MGNCCSTTTCFKDKDKGTEPQEFHLENDIQQARQQAADSSRQNIVDNTREPIA